jgi:hypothetical protein
MLKIVQFKNGKYAVRRGNWWTGYTFSSAIVADCWFHKEFGHHAYFECDTLEQAKRVLARELTAEVRRRDYGKPI